MGAESSQFVELREKVHPGSLSGWHGRATTGTSSAYSLLFSQVLYWHGRATTGTSLVGHLQFFLPFSIIFRLLPTKQREITRNK